MSTTPWRLEARHDTNLWARLATCALIPLQTAMQFAPLLFLGMLLIFLFRPPDVDLYELDRLGFLVLVTVSLGRAVLLRKPLWPSVPLILPMFLLLLLAVFSTVGQTYDSQTLSLLAAKFAVPYSLYYLAGLTFDSPASLRHLENFLLIVLAYLSFTAIAQLLGWDGLVFPRYILDPDIGIHMDRARGPFLQAVANGVTLNLLGLVALDRFRRGQLRGLAGVVLLSALPIAILATMTRAVWLSFVGSVAWLGLSQRGVVRKASIALIAVAALGVAMSLALPKSDAALMDRAGEQGPIEIRMAIYRAALGMASEKPIFGWGVNQMPQEVAQRLDGYRLQAYWAHNSYLEILVENGVVGLGLYLVIAVGLFRAGRVQSPHQVWTGTLAGPGFRRLWPVLLCVYLFNACFVVMNYQFVNALVFTLAGVLAAPHPAPPRLRYASSIAARR